LFLVCSCSLITEFHNPPPDTDVDDGCDENTVLFRMHPYGDDREIFKPPQELD
jgi:hypothetical protein